MGLIGDILMLPIRLIKLPIKLWTLPLRIPGRIIFGSKKDQAAAQIAKDKAEKEAEKAAFEKEKQEMREKASGPVPFFMSGNPDDMATVCKFLPADLKDEKVKSICAAAKRSGGSRRVKRSGRRKTRRFKKILMRK
jgi:hypothetical protein